MVIQFAKSIMDLTDKLGADAVTDFINAYKTVETDMHFLAKSKVSVGRSLRGELKSSLLSMPMRAYR
jgi:alcohol dehydrogenase, propanol-preferring